MGEEMEIHMGVQGHHDKQVLGDRWGLMFGEINKGPGLQNDWDAIPCAIVSIGRLL